MECQVLDNLPHDLVYSPDQVSPWMEVWIEKVNGRFVTFVFSSEPRLCTTTVLCLLLCLLFMWVFSWGQWKILDLSKCDGRSRHIIYYAIHIFGRILLSNHLTVTPNATSLWLMIVHGDAKYVSFLIEKTRGGSSLRWKVVCCYTVSSWHASFMLDFVLQSSLFSYSIIEGLPLFPYVEHICHPCA